ncbi:MAG: hypothetical protein K0S18_287 [Anaerocolumna sp.]|jgi:hypothetical protein|nr:hypothetical protein [Anaerocolumna sp.]
MNKNQDKIKAALESIEAMVSSINMDKDWLSYLSFQSQFYNYSSQNAMLIWVQNPEARYVKGYKSWNTLGRFVKKGSKGIQILAPCMKTKVSIKEPTDKKEYHDAEAEKVIQKVLTGFRVAYVYDFADTDGSEEHLPILIKGLSSDDIESEKKIYEKVLKVVSSYYEVREVDKIASKGSYNLETQVICVRSDLEYLQKIKTLLHEFAHAIDFQKNPEKTINRNIRELIAESTAYVVSLRLGLDTSRYSVSYIKSWLKDSKELKDIADTVQKISYQIINEIVGSEQCSYPFFNEMEDA